MTARSASGNQHLTARVEPLLHGRKHVLLQSIAVQVEIKGALDGRWLLKDLAQHGMGEFSHWRVLPELVNECRPVEVRSRFFDSKCRRCRLNLKPAQARACFVQIVIFLGEAEAQQVFASARTEERGACY